ncbi:MAG TPA: VTT domain-containing protein, partial [Thermoanaerobaculia bacterium]
TVFTAGALSAATVRLRKDWKAYLPLLLVFLPIVALAIVATQLADMPAAGAVVTAIRTAAGEWWAMPLFVIVYAVATVFLLPLGLLSAAAALAWGWKVGGTLELVTCTISAIVPYLLARRGMSGWIERRLAKQEVPALDSTFILLILRIVPIVPYVALNYIAGALKVRPRDYILTTLFGSIPSVFLFAYFIDTMAEGALGIATQARLVAVCVLVAVVAIVLRLAAKRLRVRGDHQTARKPH